jgi:hypothetical protein
MTVIIFPSKRRLPLQENKFCASSMALDVWNPFLTVALRTNICNAFGSEWQSFIRRQHQQYFALIQRLSQSRTCDQVVSAYSDFWDHAFENYRREVSTLSKLMAGMTSKMVKAARFVQEERHAPQASDTLILLCERRLRRGRPNSHRE